MIRPTRDQQDRNVVLVGAMVFGFYSLAFAWLVVREAL